MECETAKSELSQYYSAVARMTYQNLFLSITYFDDTFSLLLADMED